MTTCKLIAEMLGPLQSNEDGYTHTYVPTGYIDVRTYVCHSTHMHICTANTIHTYGHTYVRTVDIHVHTYVSLRSTNMTVDQSISYQKVRK